MLRRYKPSTAAVPHNPTSLQTVIRSVPAAEGEVINSHSIKVVPGIFPRCLPPARSEFQPLTGGPELRSYVRPWYWGWYGHQNVAPTGVQTPVPVGPATGSDKWNLIGGTIQQPRPRFTKVIATRSYPTAPEVLQPT